MKGESTKYFETATNLLNYICAVFLFKWLPGLNEESV